MTDSPKVEVHHQEDGWTAVYVDGQFRDVFKESKSYLADELIRTLFGVVTVWDDAFLLGTEGECAGNLSEIEEYKTQRRHNEERAAELRAEADQLRHQADEIEKGRYD